MITQTSRKIIVASGMAAVIGIGVVIFALRPHPVTAVVVQTLGPPPVTEIAAVPPPVAQTPDAAGTVADIPDAPAVVADHERVGTATTGTPAAAEPKPARKLHLAEAGASTADAIRNRTRNTPAAETRKPTPTTETASASVDDVKSADDVAATAAHSSPPVEDKPGTGTDLAPSDSQITDNVKSQIAGDGLSNDTNIGVTTTEGVVALTGNLASQDAIDHVKDVVGKVKDVKSVDTSALTPASP